MLEIRPFKIYLKWNKKIQKTYHRTEYIFREEIQIQDDANVNLLIENLPEDGFEIDIRFTNKTLENFEFENLKNFDEKM